MNQIEMFRKYPIETQREVFMNLIQKAENTEWGTLYGFDSIESIADFQRRVPISSYEDLKPYIEKSRNGIPNVLWPGEIKWFAKSSGTTDDKSKFIPVSSDALEDCHFKAGQDTVGVYAAKVGNTGIFKGKGLIIGGSHQINNLNNESYYGDLSAVLIQNMPFWAHFFRTPDLSIALMDEWEQKIEKMAHATIQENVTNISGVPSWTLVLIKRILEITGKKNLHEIWPNLEVFVHGGVSFLPYREQYNKLITPSKMRYMETYNASEGFFGIQDDSNTDDMLLMLDYGIFYEFIPIEDIELENPRVYTLSQVEKDKVYAMVISTNAGLWRYKIGDTVKFTSIYPFKIKIAGRTKHYINAFGEELMIDNANIAIKEACEKTHAELREYTAAPVFVSNTNKGRHQWLIEFSKLPEDLQHFVEILDNTLKTLNSDYEAKRYKDMNLTMPEVIIAPHDLFYTWLKNKGKLGGQHKIPRLANNREYMDDLLQLLHSMKSYA